MAGLIQEQTKQAVNGLPGLDQLPVLGALFRSQDFVNNQTELMVLVTPYVVRAVAQKELSRPDDGFAPVSDSASTLLARINRIYGVAARAGLMGRERRLQHVAQSRHRVDVAENLGDRGSVLDDGARGDRAAVGGRGARSGCA